MIDLIIGWGMVITIFGALFFMIAKDHGVKVLLEIIATVVGVVAWVAVAAHFLSK